MYFLKSLFLGRNTPTTLGLQAGPNQKLDIRKVPLGRAVPANIAAGRRLLEEEETLARELLRGAHLPLVEPILRASWPIRRALEESQSPSDACLVELARQMRHVRECALLPGQDPATL